MCPGGLLELLSKTQDVAWDFFEKLAWDTYAFEQVRKNFGYPTHGEYGFHANPYQSDYFTSSHDPSSSFVPPFLCNYYESSDHDVHTCLYRDYVDAIYARVKKAINDMTDKMIENMKKRIAEYSLCFSHKREDINFQEPDSSLGSPKPEVSLYDDFKPSYVVRRNLNEDMPLPSLERESDTHTSLSADLVPHTSSPKDVTEDVLVYANPPTSFNHSLEFEVDEDLENPSELDMSITSDIDHHEIDEPGEILLPETCVEVIEPTILDFDDATLSVEYESFSCRFYIIESFDEGFCA